MSFPFLGEHTMEKAFLCEDYIRNWEKSLWVWQENQANFGRTYGLMSLTWRHHQFDGHEFEQDLGVGNGQGSLVCFSPWSLKESDVTEPLNWTGWCVRFKCWGHPEARSVLLSKERLSEGGVVQLCNFTII